MTRGHKIRAAQISRKTTETKITGLVVIDGTGKSDVKTGIGFLDHMLTLMRENASPPEQYERLGLR